VRCANGRDGHIAEPPDDGSVFYWHIYRLQSNQGNRACRIPLFVLGMPLQDFTGLNMGVCRMFDKSPATDCAFRRRLCDDIAGAHDVDWLSQEMPAMQQQTG
jgi:hypothetical protein